MIRRRTPLKRSTKPIRRSRIKGLSVSRYGSLRQKEKFANDLWRKLIYRKTQGLCLRCLKRPFHDAAHGFIKGKYRAVRFDLDNGLPLCRACHRAIDCDHLAKEMLFRRELGDEKYEALKLRALAQGGRMDVDLTIMQLEHLTEEPK